MRHYQRLADGRSPGAWTDDISARLDELPSAPANQLTITSFGS